jgi:hypothetical protein
LRHRPSMGQRLRDSGHQVIACSSQIHPVISTQWSWSVIHMQRAWFTCFKNLQCLLDSISSICWKCI